MNQSTRRRVWDCTITVFVLAAAGSLFCASAGAQNQSLEGEKIAPYTGPPVYLDEPEQKPAATLVERQVVTDKYEDGTVRVEREIARYSDDRRTADGKYREFYPQGKLFVEGEYRAGAQHGEWTYWHENGTKNRTATYKNGKPDGSWEVFRADGTLEAKRSYKEAKRDGTWIYYDETGEKPLGEEQYTDGKANGLWKAWFPSGQLKKQIGFKMGVRDGEALEWNEEGKKRVEVTYVEGKPHGPATVWAPDGRKFVQVYEQGKIIKQAEE